MKTPKVSVLMPFYDDGTPKSRGLLLQALQSVLSQDFSDFEIVLVVSGEKSFSEKLAKKHRKIKLVYFKQRPIAKNRPLSERLEGIVTARNLCLRHARAPLVAYADFDDLSHPSRLRAQYDFLSTHPQIGAVGSSMVLIDGAGKKIGFRSVLQHDEQIRRHFLQFNPVPQPTIMARKALIIKAGAYTKGEFAEDYDLWVRMAAVTKFHNLAFPYVSYRVHGLGGATAYKFDLYLSALRVKWKAANTLGIFPGPKDIAVNLLLAASLFFPEGLRRTSLERLRGKFVISK